MKNLVLYFVLLILDGAFHLISDVFYKILRFSTIFLIKNFEYFLVQDGQYLNSLFILSLVIFNRFLEKYGYK